MYGCENCCSHYPGTDQTDQSSVMRYCSITRPAQSDSLLRFGVDLFAEIWERVMMFVTSAEEGYVFGSACLSVCLSVRWITRKLVNGF